MARGRLSGRPLPRAANGRAIFAASQTASAPAAEEGSGSRLAVRRRDVAQTWAAQTWAAARRTGFRPWLGWPLLGLLLVVLGLTLPWFAIPLQADRSAWSLPVVLAGAPFLSPVSYGAALAACLGLGLIAMIRSRGRPSAPTAAAGLLVLLVSVIFVMAAGTANWPLLQQLSDQTAEQAAIFQQFGYSVPAQPPTLMLFVPVTGTWALLGGALRLGWFSAAAGGLALLLSGASSLASWARRAGWRAMLLLALGLLIVVGVLGRGAAAAYLAERGSAAARAGDYPAARASLGAAHRLNPLLASSSAYDLALGQVMLAAGQRGRTFALLAEANARGASGDLAGQVRKLERAVALSPGNPVVQQQLGQASQRLALTSHDPGTLQALHRPTAADKYTEGRVRYAAADYPGALMCFHQVLAMTRDINVTSSAYAYIGLSELKMGRLEQARLDLLRAVSVDTGYNNTLARSLVAGLYVANDPGGS